MLREAAIGARSRKSINVVRPSARRINMNPPPPMLPALGCVTASASPTATAASIALPPFCRTSSPTAVAWRSRDTTMPWRARTGCAAQPHTGVAISRRANVWRIPLDSTMRLSWVYTDGTREGTQMPKRAHGATNKGNAPTIACFNKAETPLGFKLADLVVAMQVYGEKSGAPAGGTPPKLVESKVFIRGAWAIVFLDPANQPG